jgi:uncharacterized protein YkwD
MRSSIIIASAMVTGALARPQPYRRQPKVVYETEVVTQTVVVTVILPSVGTTEYDEMPYVEATETLEPYYPSAVLSTTAEPTETPSPSPEPSPSSSSSSSTLASSSVVRATPAVSPAPAPVSSSAPEPAAPSNNHPPGIELAYLSAGADYQAAIIHHHNKIRANHDAAPLTWDSDCEANARIAAKRCNFKHFIPQGAGEGQNLYTTSGPAFNVTGGITQSWYNGELAAMQSWFGKPSIPHDVFEKVGHLTQLVWKSTTKVGCVTIDCGGAMTVNDVPSSLNKYTVCNYAPAGNYAGEYAKNVAPSTSAKAFGWMD